MSYHILSSSATWGGWIPARPGSREFTTHTQPMGSLDQFLAMASPFVYFLGPLAAYLAPSFPQTLGQSRPEVRRRLCCQCPTLRPLHCCSSDTVSSAFDS